MTLSRDGRGVWAEDTNKFIKPCLISASFIPGGVPQVPGYGGYPQGYGKTHILKSISFPLIMYMKECNATIHPFPVISLSLVIMGAILSSGDSIQSSM